MKPTPISIIKEHLSDGTVIEGFRGKLTKLYQLRNRGSGDTAFTKQEGELVDEKGDTIQVEFLLKGNEIMQDRRGKVVSIASHKGEKGLNGVKIIDDTYNGVTTRKLRITPTAEFTWEDGGSGTTQQQAPAQQQQSTGSAPAATQQQATKPFTPPPDSRADGQRTGMAVNNACAIIEGFNHPPEYFKTPAFSKDLWHIASRIIRVSGFLEQGKLDPTTAAPQKPKPQPEPEPPPPPPPPPAQNQQRGFDAEEDIDF